MQAGEDAAGDAVVEAAAAEDAAAAEEGATGADASAEPPSGEPSTEEPAAEEAEAEAETAAEPEGVALDVASMKLPELKEELTKRGLDATGRKADLCARLTEALQVCSNPLGLYRTLAIRREIGP